MADHKMPGEHVYKGMTMPAAFPADVIDRVPDFEFRSDDVLIATYSKSGTTWMLQIVWLILNGADVETSRKIPLPERGTYLELRTHTDLIDTLAEKKSPRLMKTHLPYSLFKQNIEGVEKPKFKTIYVMRNVRDVLVSYYHFYKIMPVLGQFDGDFEDFFQLFKKKGLASGDYFDIILSWWEAKNNPNVYFVRYEDLKKDPRKEILKVTAFLGKTLNDDQIDAIVKESSFEAMTSPELTGKFKIKQMRKGIVGDWQNHFTQEQLEYVNDRCENELLPHGLEFEYL